MSHLCTARPRVFWLPASIPQDVGAARVVKQFNSSKLCRRKHDQTLCARRAIFPLRSPSLLMALPANTNSLVCLYTWAILVSGASLAPFVLRRVSYVLASKSFMPRRRARSQGLRYHSLQAFGYPRKITRVDSVQCSPQGLRFACPRLCDPCLVTLPFFPFFF